MILAEKEGAIELPHPRFLGSPQLELHGLFLYLTLRQHGIFLGAGP